MATPSESREDRVLILAPMGRDAVLAASVLEGAGIAHEICRGLGQLRAAILEGAGAVLLTEEVLTSAAVAELAEIFRGQLPWSDLPLLVFSGGEGREGLAAPVRRFAELADITVIDRPTRKASLLSAVLAALRARRRQYEVRGLVDQLESNVRQRDQFLAMLSHELRNPLAAILAAVELMKRRGGAESGERRVVERQAHLLARLVDDLLDVSRVTLGKIALNVAPVRIRDLVARCVSNVERAARDRSVDLRFPSSDIDFVVEGDPLRLEQVVGNLLNNAVKYTPRGGEVRVSLAADGGFGEIRVADSGVGIDPEVLTRIFEPFTQADSTIDRSEGGLGIGLTLVRNLVHLHGGTVSAESPGRGRGSTFVVRLPRLATAVPAAAPRSAPVRIPARRVLIVEDNVDVREGLKSLLEDLGHEVFASADGEEGVDVAVNRRPDVLLVDIGLPKLDGYGLAKRIRSGPAKKAFLVAITGYGSPEDRRRALEAGFDAHLTKPVTLDAVQVLLERAETSGGANAGAGAQGL